MTDRKNAPSLTRSLLLSISLAQSCIVLPALAVETFDLANAARLACWASQGSNSASACRSYGNDSQSTVFVHHVATILQSEQEGPRQVKRRGWCPIGDPVVQSCNEVEFAYMPEGCPGAQVGSQCNSPKDEQAGPPPCESEGGNPINLLTGNKVQIEQDFTTAGLFPLMHERSYNSTAGVWTVFPTLTITEESEQVPATEVPFCSKTIDSETNLITFNGCFYGNAPMSNNNIMLSFKRPNGRVIRATFTTDGNGLPLNPTQPSIGIEAAEKIRGVLDASDNLLGWEITLSDDSVEFYDTTGALQLRTHRNGIAHTYSYDSNSVLQTITDDFGNSLTYTFDTNGQVSTMTDPDGHLFRYGYDSQDRLISVAYPDNTPGNTSDNPTRLFHYENATYPTALTGITDERGIRFATWSYDSAGRAQSSVHSGGVEDFQIDFSNLNDPLDPRVTTTNALGKTATYHLDNPAGIPRVRHIEGHASTNCAASSRYQTFDSAGNVTSRTDSLGNVTEYEYNARNLETLRREAVGTAVERVVETEWHGWLRLPTKITQPDRVIEMTYDDDGNVLSRIESALP